MAIGSAASSPDIGTVGKWVCRPVVRYTRNGGRATAARAALRTPLVSRLPGRGAVLLRSAAMRAEQRTAPTAPVTVGAPDWT